MAGILISPRVYSFKRVQLIIGSERSIALIRDIRGLFEVGGGDLAKGVYRKLTLRRIL